MSIVVERANPTGRKYRFFYHFYRQRKMMSVHFRGQCHIVRNVVCNSPCQTKFNKTQPFLVMQGFAKKVRLTEDLAIID